MVLKGRLFLYSLLLLFAVSCKNGAIKNDENLVFRYNEHSNISSLDPAFAKDISDIWVVNQLFNGLVQLDEQLEVKPDLATNWSVSDDGLTYIFNLRKDVYFHSNEVFGDTGSRLVTAQDFEFSFNRLLDEKTASPGKWVLQKVAEFEALDKHTFKIVR